MLRAALLALLAGLAGAAGLGAAAAGVTSGGLPLPGGAGGFLDPLPGAPVSQPYGCTALAIEPPSPVCPRGHIHTGVDLAAVLGTPVRAAAAGVAEVRLSATGYGLHVVVDHGGGLSSLYAHLSAVAVGDGDTVSAGQVIGAVGSSGTSTGPHLHFEIRRDGLPEDPEPDLVQTGADPAPHQGEPTWSTESSSSATSPATPRPSPPARR